MKKIAEILSTWDRAIETTEKLLANAEAQKKALMQQLLTGQRRLKGFEGEWREVRLGKPWSQYQQVIVETYAATKSGKSSKIHVRPIPGQLFPTTMDVECSRSMRTAHPVGTRFRIHVKETCREGGKPFLYSHFNWPFEVVTV
eukprot:jgi/Tetstr1/460456/TSEL_005715.t1